ncbi:glycosyltransferase family 61 protein [Paenibacillus pini]|uniref:Tetratricopeptide TPR_2 n=1 Tax=Paenibacillus pini JCM 16418 TaxID=1236976 RepID=W7YBD5_9BACL|nr:glycosyltransferase family 61 protein [Paenibacillus pini]GAF08135.1 tetratricopeptide TPR_2 [Paenibacillus pini JCM 16418]
MNANTDGIRPAGYVESTEDWVMEKKNAGFHGYFIQTFDFGGESHFVAPQSVESGHHPYLTAYSLKPPRGFVASIPGGRLWGRSAAVLTPEGRLLSDVSHEYDEKLHTVVKGANHPIFTDWNHSNLISAQGTTASLGFCGSYNYFHWMYDVMARWGMLLETGISFDQVMINPNPYGTFVEQTLSMLGTPKEKIIRTYSTMYVEAEQLLVPSLIMDSHYPAWATEMLRRMFLPHQHVSYAASDRFYICRKRAGARRIVNEEQVMDYLASIGFRPLVLEQMSLAEQIRAFAVSRVIVAPHGAGLTNLAFCEPGTKVIEIFHPEHIMPTYWMISNHRQLNYYFMYANRQSVQGITFAGLEDIYVDIDKLKRTLRLAEIE